jgi:uncharacterized protein YbjQ (UPF0145 family)
MEQFPQSHIEFGRWYPNKYDRTLIFKAAQGISVSAKQVPKKASEFGINVMGKDLDVYFNNIEEAQKEALLALRKHLSTALDAVKAAEVVVV